MSDEWGQDSQIEVLWALGIITHLWEREPGGFGVIPRRCNRFDFGFGRMEYFEHR
jgi:hypothetical protein